MILRGYLIDPFLYFRVISMNERLCLQRIGIADCTYKNIWYDPCYGSIFFGRNHS